MKSSQQGQSGGREQRRVSEWGVGYRVAGPLVVLLALVFGAAQWVGSGADMTARGETQAGSTPDAALVEAYRKTLDAAE